MAGMLHAELDWFSAFFGGEIAVEQVAHCLVEVTITKFFGSQQCGLTLGGTGGRGSCVDEMGQG